MSITGCLLVKNEEHLIQGCLDSIKLVSDEIIVVDNGSVDGTIDIAIKNGCKVIYSPNTIVDEGRNVYLENVKTDWVFVLDADERITQDTADTIINACKNAEKDLMYFITSKFEYIGNGKFSESESSSRVFRSHQKIRYDVSPIHSSVKSSIQRLGGKHKYLFAPIHHLDFLHGKKMSEKRMKYRCYLENVIKKSSELNRIWFQYFTLATEYTCLEEYDKAIKYYELSELNYKNTKKLNDDKLDRVRISISQTYLKMGRLDLAKKEAESIINSTSRFIDRAFYVLAEIEIRDNKLNKAVDFCNVALEHNPNSIFMLLNLASLIDIVNPDKAIVCLEKAIKLNSYLLNPLIYTPSEESNVFSFQACFLSTFKSLFFHMARCYREKSDYKNEKKWLELEQEILKSSLVSRHYP